MKCLSDKWRTSEWQVPCYQPPLVQALSTTQKSRPMDKAHWHGCTVGRCWHFKWVSSALLVIIVLEEKGGSCPMYRKPRLVRQAEFVIFLKAASLQEWLNSGKNLQLSSGCCETFWRVFIALASLISSPHKCGTEGEMHRAKELVLKIQHYRIAHSRCFPRKHLPLKDSGLPTKNTVTQTSAH